MSDEEEQRNGTASGAVLAGTSLAVMTVAIRQEHGRKILKQGTGRLKSYPPRSIVLDFSDVYFFQPLRTVQLYPSVFAVTYSNVPFLPSSGSGEKS